MVHWKYSLLPLKMPVYSIQNLSLFSISQLMMWNIAHGLGLTLVWTMCSNEGIIVQKIEATNWFILLPSNLYVVDTTSSYLLFLRCNNGLTWKQPDCKFFYLVLPPPHAFHSQKPVSDWNVNFKWNLISVQKTINIRTPAIIGRSYTETKPRRY